MKTQQVSDKGILAQKITETQTASEVLTTETKKNINLAQKLSLRPQKSLIRKSIRPMNLFSSSKLKEN